MKKINLLVFGFLAMFGLVFSVNAQSLPLADEEGKIVMTEDVVIEETFVVKSGEKITLDLGEYTLTNSGDFDTIKVLLGGELIIEGSGVITNTALNKAPLFNNGKTTINGGTISVKADDTAFYAILNHGEMIVNEGATIKMVEKTGYDKFSGHSHPSLIDNGYSSYTSTDERKGYVEGVNQAEATLTVNGGTFDGGLNTIKNDDASVLIFNNGHVKNNIQVALLNWNKATINGGTFEVPSGYDKTTIANRYTKDYDKNQGVLKITGGTFKANYILMSKENSNSNDVTITGGIFEAAKALVNTTDNRPDIEVSITGGTYTVDVKDYVTDETLKVTELDGKFVVEENKVIESKDENVTFESEEALPNDYVLVVEKLEKEMESTNELVVDLYKDNEKVESATLLELYEIDVEKEGVVQKIEDGSFQISIAIDEKLQKYDNYKVVYIVDGKIEEEIDAKLVDGKIVFETTHLSTYGIVGYNNVIEHNPSTLDGITSYILTAIISLIGITSAVIYANKKRFN